MVKMLLICIFFVSVLTVFNSEVVNEGGFCDLKKESCDIPIAEDKYLFYDVNQPEGFNLRRDVYMRFAIMMHEAKRRGKNNWRVVLPPWHRLHHWKSISPSAEPAPWSLFFDVDSLKKFAPVIEFNEIYESHKNSLELDRIYVLQNYEDAFEDGTFTEKWEITKDCVHNRHYSGYKYKSAKEVICVKFQGKISKLWELISLHPSDKYVMFVHGEIPLHDYYGTKTYWDCRKSMKFNKQLIEVAKQYTLKHFGCKNKCSSYISVHWRRQDFARARKKDVPSIKGTSQQIHKALSKYNLNTINIFIATDATQSEIQEIVHALNAYGLKVHFYTPTKREIDEYQDGGVAIIEQIICSHALYFVGTHESTFTFRIQEEREILGLKSWTTFNRLCPDSGRCEKPSQWTIVH